MRDNAASLPDDIESLRCLVAAQSSELDGERAARMAVEGALLSRDLLIEKLFPWPSLPSLCVARFLRHGALGGQPCAKRAPRRGSPYCPIARWPAPITDRIVLALELAGLCAAEVALSLEVIDERRGVTPYEPIAGAGHARGRIMAYGLGESWRPR
jgi:hypothetical protein